MCLCQRGVVFTLTEYCNIHVDTTFSLRLHTANKPINRPGFWRGADRGGHGILQILWEPHTTLFLVSSSGCFLSRFCRDRCVSRAMLYAVAYLLSLTVVLLAPFVTAGLSTDCYRMLDNQISIYDGIPCGVVTAESVGRPVFAWQILR